MAIPIRLSGVEAPDVKPIVTSPFGIQPVAVVSCEPPTGLWRISSADRRLAGSAM
jgi:hypothetical protein